MNPNEIVRLSQTSLSRIQFLLGKYSPEILTTLGISSFTGAIVSGVFAGKNHEKIMEKHRVRMALVEQDNDPEAKRTIISETAFNLVRNYTPTVALGLFGAVDVIAGLGIMKNRANATAAAYATLAAAFTQYRETVKASFGEESEALVRNGYVPVYEEVEKKDGKNTKKELVLKGYDPIVDPESDFSRLFDEANQEWKNDPDMNRYFVRAVENALNDRLQAKGYVFLNEAYSALGFRSTPYGQVVGWVKKSRTGGDGYIDFGIEDLKKYPENVRFLRGEEKNITLRFNVDGIIYDLLGPEFY